MKVYGDFTVWCFECDCISLIFALIFGILTFISVYKILKFFKWKIMQEQEFDRAIFENFRRRTLPVGNAQNNEQKNGTTPGNGNIQNSGGADGK